MRQAKSATLRFWSKVDQSGECWIWTGAIRQNGYGQFYKGGLPKQVVAHRFAYELLMGPVAAGLDLDHTCHNAALECPGGVTCLHRRCVRPDHLEPVTRGVNVRRGRLGAGRTATECSHGHSLADAYEFPSAPGHRRCRPCYIAGRESRQARLTAAELVVSA